MAITERLTLLIVQRDRDPAMILPILERPDAEQAPSGGTITLTAWTEETEVATDLADLLVSHGHSQVDFTVVGSGPNGANPHHEAGDRTIQDGDMVVLDFGGLKDG